MRVQDMLGAKGDFVATVGPDASVADVADALAHHGIGALVVSPDGSSIAGIVSERDLARALARHRAAALDRPVTDVMTTDVRTCRLDDTCADLMRIMTTERIRHVPVVDGERLVGIISIGDVVKRRLDELSEENGALHEYLYSGR